MRTLRPYQQAAFASLRGQPRALLADEMGLGKTPVSIALAAARAQTLPFPARTLVIVPPQISAKWAREIRMDLPDAKVLVVCANKRAAKMMNQVQFDEPLTKGVVASSDPDEITAFDEGWLVLPYSLATLARFRNVLQHKTWHYLIADEVHRCKSKSTGRSKGVRELCGRAEAAVGLTGSPFLTSGEDICGILYALGCLPTSRDYQAHLRNYFQYEQGVWGGGTWKQTDPKGHGAYLRQHWMVRREKKEVEADLPAKQVDWAAVSVDNKLVDAQLAEWASKSPERELSPGAMLNKAYELVAIQKAGTPLAEWIDEWNEPDEQLVIWAHNAAVLEQAAETVRQSKGRSGTVAVLSGKNSPQDREAIIGQFQRGAVQTLVCSIRACAEGTEMTAACHALFLQQDWAPLLNTQAEDRIHRIGQKRSAFIYRLTADHRVDEIVRRAMSARSEEVSKTLSSAAAALYGDGNGTDAALSAPETDEKPAPSPSAAPVEDAATLTVVPDAPFPTAAGEAGEGGIPAPRISPSTLKGIQDCPRRTISRRFGRELRAAGWRLLPDEIGVSALVGTLTHDIVTVPLAERSPELIDTKAQELYARESEGRSIMFDAGTPNLEALVKQATSLATAVDVISKGRLQRGMSYEVPLKKELKLGGRDVMFSGRADFYEPVEGRLLELKTSGSYQAQDYGIQLALYDVLLNALGKPTCGEATVYWVRRVRAGRPQPPGEEYVYDLTPYKPIARELVDQTVRFHDRFWEGGQPNPMNVLANPNSNLCSPKFCPLYGTGACDLTDPATKRRAGIDAPDVVGAESSAEAGTA